MDLSYEAALSQVLAALPPPQVERIPLSGAHNRILAERVLSPAVLPPFDNSSMDGYAVRSEDVSSAKPESPARLRLLGKVAAGETFDGLVTAGTCVRLFTGSPLPRGADAVLRQEDVRTESGAPAEVLALSTVKPWENVRLCGEDVKDGDTLAETGAVLTAGRLSLLAAVGLAEVRVGCRPAVALLATGSELREAGQALAPGQIYESTRLALAALAHRAGVTPKVLPLVADEPAATRLALANAFSECDVVVTSGGVSVGEFDFVKSAFQELGGDVQFWRVAIRPGRPFVFGRRQEKFLFGLPGNPVSALVTFLLLVRPALLRWQGATEVSLPAHPGVLADTLANPGARRHFIRVQVERDGRVHSPGMQASHALGSLAAANGLVDVPPQSTLKVGTAVQVLRWE